jgi:hypothetical protein
MKMCVRANVSVDDKSISYTEAQLDRSLEIAFRYCQGG